MAKKRKGLSRKDDTPPGPNLDVGSSKKRIRSFEDVADSDDEFHLNRDRVLLDEGRDAKRRRKLEEEEEFLEPSDEEVLSPLEVSDTEVEEDGQQYREDVVDHGLEESEDDAEDEEEGLGWGTAKDDMYGADEIETEEQALEEEAEALRLQKKQLQSMAEADYGFDEDDWQQNGAHDETTQQDRVNVVTEVLPELRIGEEAGPTERLKLLKSRYPEFEPLNKELLQVEEKHKELVKDLKARSERFATDQHPNATTKVRAASAYLGVLVMYFTLLSSPAAKSTPDVLAMSASQLRDHPVMDSLVQCRELWLRVEQLPADPEPSHIDEHTLRDRSHRAEEVNFMEQLREQRPAKKTRAQKHADAVQAATEARRAERMERTEADLAGLDALIRPSTSRKSRNSKTANIPGNDLDSDNGEEAPLTAQEAAEKAKRKKSLRFYTSQIAQKANKRGAAGRNAGGDDDIPYRERLRDRQARLNAEAEKRGRKNADTSADLGGESDEEDRRRAQELRNVGDGDDYYDLVAARTAKKKVNKAAYGEAQKQAALAGGRVVEEETVGPDGKRKITYAIEKNKGLTPHRKKEVRNPRVKKRKKFDASKKKLASMKPVYKGGEARGGYGGELTGIKTGLVKSTRL